MPQYNYVAVDEKSGKEIKGSIEAATEAMAAAELRKEGLFATKLKEATGATVLDALALATEAGNTKAVNVVLIGVMAKNTDIPYEKWIDAIKATVPAKFLDVNLKAFDLGYHHE